MLVAVIDDDFWRRESMTRALSSHADIDVVLSVTQDDVLASTVELWNGIDLAIVDVLDERAPGEVGTDLYSGIMALDHLRDLPVRTLAITPHEGHPIVQLRLYQAGPDWVYYRWELNDPEALVEALCRPMPSRQPRRPTADELREFGVASAQVNEVIKHYEKSELYGRVHSTVGLKHLTVSRRTLDRFRSTTSVLGFRSTEQLSTVRQARRTPRWPDVRSFLLVAMGRPHTSDAPSPVANPPEQ